MSNLNKRLFEKYIEKVGWPELLYQILKEVYIHSVNSSPNLQGALEEAKDVLEAYEEYITSSSEIVQVLNRRKGPVTYIKKPSNNVSSIVKEARMVVEEDKGSIKPTFPPDRVIREGDQPPELKKSKPILPKLNNREEITRVTVLLPLEGPEFQIKKLRGIVRVDSPIGDCQGTLPIPERYEITNRHNIRIETKTGLELCSIGGVQLDGQIQQCPNISGRIRTDGRYDLVFKDIGLGEAIIYYEVVEKRESKEVELKMFSQFDTDTGSWVSFIREPEIVVNADLINESKSLLFDELSKKYGMRIVSAAVLKRSEDNKEEFKLVPKVVSLQPPMVTSLDE